MFSEKQKDGLRQPVLCFNERAEAVGKFFGQHRNDRSDEIGGVAPTLCFAIERRLGFDVSGDIGDVDADPGLAAFEFFNGDRVVEVFRIVGVNRECRHFAVIKPSLDLRGEHVIGKIGDLAFYGGREFGIEAVFLKYTKHLCLGFMCATET